MMSLQTLKELLKSPFSSEHFVVSDSNNKSLCLSFGNDSTIADIIAAALNEKWERDFSEPLRWIVIMLTESNGGYFICPKCEKESGIFWHGESVDDIEDLPNYCPYCGIRLYPPEEKT